MIRRSLAVSLAFVVAAGCTQTPPASPPVDNSGDQSPGLTGDQKSDWDRIVQLEDQAKTLVNASGCTSADQCRTAPVGSRACGGPRYYLVYCARTTDSAALFRKLDEVKRAEEAYNTKYQIGSTCEFRSPPAVALSGGACASR